MNGLKLLENPAVGKGYQRSPEERVTFPLSQTSSEFLMPLRTGSES